VIPMLMGWVGLCPLAARGAALAVSLFTASVAGLTYASHGMLDHGLVYGLGVNVAPVHP